MGWVLESLDDKAGVGCAKLELLVERLGRGETSPRQWLVPIRGHKCSVMVYRKWVQLGDLEGRQATPPGGIISWAES